MVAAWSVDPFVTRSAQWRKHESHDRPQSAHALAHGSGIAMPPWPEGASLADCSRIAAKPAVTPPSAPSSSLRFIIDATSVCRTVPASRAPDEVRRTFDEWIGAGATASPSL
jgi:hypothetical protein